MPLKFPAARISDKVAAGVIITGEPTVLIGSAAKPVACTACKAQEILSQGSPVNVMLGIKYLNEDADFYLPAPQVFSWKRFYASDVAWTGSLGQGWRTTTDIVVDAVEDGIGGHKLMLRDIQGRTVDFGALMPGEEKFSPSEQMWMRRGGNIAPSSHNFEETSNQWKGVWQWVPPAFRDNEQSVIVTPGNGDYLVFAAPNSEEPQQQAGLVRAKTAIDKPVLILQGRLPLIAITNAVGYTTNIRWEGILSESGQIDCFPVGVTDSAGRRYKLHYSRLGERHNGQWYQEQLQGENALRVREQNAPDSKTLSQDVGLRLVGITLEFEPCRDNAAPKALPANPWIVRYGYAETGDLVDVMDRHGQHTRQFGYQNHMMVRHTVPNGGVDVSYIYDRYEPSGKVTQQTQEEGLNLRFQYLSNETRVTDGLGRLKILRFEGEAGLRRVIEITQTAISEFVDATRAKSTVRFEYNNDGNLVATLDPLNRRTVYHLDSQGRVVAIVDPLGHREDQHRDKETGALEATSNSEGRRTALNRETHGRVSEVIGADGSKTQYVYANAKLPDRPSAIIDARGGTRCLTYNSRGQLSAFTDCSGKTTMIHHDDADRVDMVQNSIGERIIYIRDAKGQLTQLQYPDGQKIDFQYDYLGRPIKSVNCVGQEVETSYDRFDRVIKHAVFALQTLPGGDLTKSNQRIGSSREVISTYGFQYDAAGRVITITNAASAVSRFSYDSLDRLIEETGFDGKVTQYRYNEASEVMWKSEGDIIVTYEHDAGGRLTARHLPSVGGNPAQTHRYRYNKLNQLTDADTGDIRVLFEYDIAGRLICETTVFADEEQHAVTYGYDVLGNQNQLTLPDGRIVNALTYGSGHWHQINIDGNRIIDVERDDLHREIKRFYGDGVTSDSNSQVMLSRTQSYTPMGFLAQSALTQESLPGAISINTVLDHRVHHYSGTGLLTQIDQQLAPFTATDALLRNRQLHYTYDLNNRLVGWRTLEQLRKSSMQGIIALTGVRNEIYGFDKASNPIDMQQPVDKDRDTELSELSVKWPTQTAENWASQVRANLSDKAFNVLANSTTQLGDRIEYVNGVTLTYDVRGNVVKRHDHHAVGAQLQEYSWDAANQLRMSARRTHLGGSLGTMSDITSYQYDAFGRRVMKNHVVFTEDAQGLLQLLPPSADGTGSSITRYVWDADRMLQQQDAVQRGGVEQSRLVTIIYEPDGYIPVAQIVDYVTVNTKAAQIAVPRSEVFAALANPHTAREMQKAGYHRNEVRAESQHFVDSHLGYLHTDHIGTPYQMTDEKGKVLWDLECDPWGNPLSELTAVDFNLLHSPTLRFQGQQFDSETGLHYNRYRYYDPKTHRYLSQDPIGLQGGMNHYAYPTNPVQWIDPTGTDATPGGPSFGIGIEANNSAAYSKGTHYLMTDTGHTIAYLKDDKGKITCTLSVGPSKGIGMTNAKDFRDGKLPGKTNWPADETIRAFEKAMTPEQYAKCQKSCEDAKKKTIMYTPQYQCTSAALALAKECGVPMPAGVGPVKVVVGGVTASEGNYVNPYKLNEEMSAAQTPTIYKPGELKTGLPSSLPPPPPPPPLPAASGAASSPAAPASRPTPSPPSKKKG